MLIRTQLYLAVALSLLVSKGVQAVPFVESEPGPAAVNDTLGTATDVSGVGSAVEITATIRDTSSMVDDIDFFRIFATAGSNITLRVDGPTTGSLSPAGGTMDVALFDSTGLLVAYDNNTGTPTNPARIDPFNIATTGFYFVSVSEWSEEPNALSGSPIYTPLANFGFAVSNVAADATWADSGGQQHGGETYLLSITGLTATVPEPGTLALFGLGLAGLGFARRRKVAA